MSLAYQKCSKKRIQSDKWLLGEGRGVFQLTGLDCQFRIGSVDFEEMDPRLRGDDS